MAERVAVYIDGANAYFAQKDALGWWIDWPSFLSYFRKGRELVSARWYQAYRVAPGSDQERFLHHLTLVGFAVRKKLLKKVVDRSTGETSLKGNLDIELAIDVLSEVDLFDTAVLVTGDSDFVPLVEALRTRGKRVIVAATQKNVAVELRQSVGVNFLELDEVRSQIESEHKSMDREKAAESGATDEDLDEYDEEIADQDDGDEDFEDFDDEDDFDDDYEDEYDEDGALVPPPNYRPAPAPPDPEDIDLPLEGEIIRANVQAVKKYGVFLDLHEYAKTLLHVKDMNRGFVPDAGEFYEVGEEVTAQIVSIDRTKSPPEVRVQVVTPEMEY